MHTPANVRWSHCRLAVVGALMVGLTAAASAQTQSWNYKYYLKDPISGNFSKEKFATATISLVEQDGKASFRMVTPGRGDLCASRGDLPAEVERNAATTAITVTPSVPGCEPFRYVIRNDGSGGIRQFRRNDKWVPDGYDHDLTPVK